MQDSWYIGPFGIVLGIVYIATLITGGALAGVLPDKREEGGTAGLHAIVAINTTELRGKDAQKLRGLQVDILTDDTARFSTADFSVEGNITMHPHSEPSKGFVTGGLSFQIPGLETKADGTFVLVNKTCADEKTRDHFEKVHASLRESHPYPMDPADAIARIAQAL